MMKISLALEASRPTRGWAIGLAALVLGLGAAACSGVESEDPALLATVDGEPVTMADVNEQVGGRLARMDREYRKQRHELIEAALEAEVRERLMAAEAERRGITVQELRATEIDARVEVSEEDVTAWYESNHANLGGRSLEDLAPRIRQFLVDSERQRAYEQLGQKLAAGKDIEIFLEPLRVELDNEGAPARGPAGAKVTVVEFSDFECPYCGRFYETLKRLEEEYGDRIRIVYRHYPIDTHPNAFQAAVASLCAHEQDHFWEMHDSLFEDQSRLDEASLVERAEDLGLDLEAFESCLASDRHDGRIRRDIREADLAGVTGTPALFVNGIAVPGGAVPYETIAQVIDEELER